MLRKNIHDFISVNQSLDKKTFNFHASIFFITKEKTFTTSLYIFFISEEKKTFFLKNKCRRFYFSEKKIA